MHPFRTDRCGELDETDVGRRVRLSGWVVNVRPLGRLAFALLRDSTGPIQIIASGKESVARLQSLKPGAVATVDGRVERRRAQDVNEQLRTGSIEVRLAALREWQGAACTDLHETAGPGPGARAELLVRDHLHHQGFTEVTVGDRDALAGLLPRHERVFRVRTAVGPAGGHRLLEFESAFTTLDDLHAQVRNRAIAVSAALPSSPTMPLTTVPLAEILGTTKGPEVVGQLRFVHGLPVTGLAALDGHDRRLTLLSEPDSVALGTGETAQGTLARCLLLLGHGRLIGAGGLRRGDLGDLTRRHNGSLEADPLLREEVLDLIRTGHSPGPGEAWFILDLDGLGRAVAVDDGSAEQVTSSSRFPSMPVIIGDLTALLREADLTGAGHAPRNESDVAQAGRIERWDVEASAAMARSRTASPSRPTAPAGGGDPWAEHRALLDGLLDGRRRL
jgi:hypothetical protein